MLLNKKYGQPLSEGLTSMPSKAMLYSLDLHFRDGWEDLIAIAGETALAQAQAHSLILVRPDAIASRKAHLLFDWLPANGFRLTACMPLSIDRHQVRSLWQYQWNVALRERRDACDALMSAGPSLLLVIANEGSLQKDATRRFSELKGAADPALRRPGDLRAVLGHKSRMLSLVHSPDEPADFVRETAICLPERQRKALFARMKHKAVIPMMEAHAEVAKLYDEVAEHPLDLDGALARVVAAADAVARPAESESRQAGRLAVTALAECIAAGMPTDWRELFLLLDRLDAPYSAWDRVVIAGYLTAMDAAGKQILLDHPPREAKVLHDAATESPTMLIDQRFGSPIAPGLTEIADKATLYAIDTYFREGWEDLVTVAGGAATELAFMHSMMLVKPDALVLRRLDVVLDWLPRHGFNVVACVPVTICADQLKALWRYQFNCAPRIRKDAYMALFEASPSVLLVVRSTQDTHVSAAKRLANLKGPADPSLQRAHELRAWLGNVTHLLSFVHAADEPADLMRELTILLPEAQRMAVYARMTEGVEVSVMELREIADNVCKNMPQHTLGLHDAIARIEKLALSAAEMNAADRAAVAAFCERVKTSTAADWRAIFDLLDIHGVRYDPWDRITIAAHTSDVSNPHLEPLLPGAVPLEALSEHGQAGQTSLQHFPSHDLR